MSRLLLVLALLLAGCASYTPLPRGEKVERNIVFAQPPTGNLHLDIYHPATQGPHPTLLWVHGGGWKYGWKGFQFYLRKMTRDGFNIVTIEYRLSGRAKYPAQMQDTRAAYLWLRQHGAEHGLQTEHIFLGGASAGGQLAAMLAVEEGHSRIDAVCAIYPATDLTAFEDPEATKGYLPDLLGGSMISHRALAESGSPIRFIRRDTPPFIIFHGDQDDLVPIAHSIAFDRKLRAHGVESKFIVLPGQPHNYVLNDEQIEQVTRFFQQHLHR